MSDRCRGGLPLMAVVLLLGLPPGAGSAEIPEPLRSAVRAELPAALAEAAGAASSGDGPGGRFELLQGEMDGTAPEEGVVVIHEAGKRPRVVFFGAAGEEVVRKTVKLPGAAAEISAAFLPFAEGRSLVHVQGGRGGAVLLAWDGRGMDVVWSSGKPREDESRWFELDDLDGDGTREIVAYQKLLIDVAPDDEMGEAVSGSSVEEARPTGVLRWDGSKWRKDEKLLGEMH